MPWQRANSVNSLNFPYVWLKFPAKDLDSDKIVDYRIQDVPENRFEDVIKHMTDFLKVSPIYTEEFDDNVEALNELQNYWRLRLQSKMSLVCFKENSDEILGVNILYVLQKGEKSFIEFKSKVLNDLFAALGHISAQFDDMEHYKVNEKLVAAGLNVSDKYSGRGIATHLLKARIPMCRVFKIKLTSTRFNTPIAQYVAKKVGFKIDFAIRKDELLELYPNFRFKNMDAVGSKSMSMFIHP